MFTLYLAQSLDGFIAGPNDEIPWSAKEWELFQAEVNKHNTLIVGRRTFDIMVKGNTFKYIKTPNILVLTTKNLASYPQLKTFNISKLANIRELNPSTHYLIAGGAKTAEYFLEKGLVDQLVLDIEFLFL